MPPSLQTVSFATAENYSPGLRAPPPRADAGSRDRASARQVPGVKVEKAER